MNKTTVLTPLASGLCAWPGDHCPHKATPIFCRVHREAIPHEWLTRPEPGPLDTPCWLFLGALDRKGYGVVMVGARRLLAHRWFYERANGPIPDGLCVLHRCDVPACVNSDHLFLGTPADNSADMVAKGRSNRGEARPQAKLTEADVRAIRAACRAGEPVAHVATRHGVSESLVRGVVSRRRWAHVR